jgi:Nucleotidyl transferase AbiEii toxin, Type IV TA system
MDHFALLPAAERATVFREAAARLRVGSATIIEKDFWVCWTLQKIFSSAALPGPLFKGGTSLSKVYKVIERFSEDVDIVLDRHTLGFVGEQDPPNIAGTNKRNRKLDELVGKCSETVQGTVRDELQNSFRSVLGEADWKISEDPADADRQSLLFAYPLGLEADLYGFGAYIRPVVRLEFGCRGDVWPSERQSIQPYIADAIPGLLARPTAEVHVLRPERTFWEKATLLHAVFHSGKMPPRLSRHHYDLARLYRHEYGQLAMKDFGLLAAVVEHKKIFFREAAARYDLAKPGSLRVCPPDVHVAEIRSDYRDMREMFFAEAPPFDTVMADLRELEDRVNR